MLRARIDNTDDAGHIVTRDFELWKVLADGQVSGSFAAIYTVPAGKIARIGYLAIFNTNVASQTVEFQLNTSGTARNWRRAIMAQNEFAEVMESGEELLLEAGDVILARTTTASAVDFVIGGVED